MVKRLIVWPHPLTHPPILSAVTRRESDGKIDLHELALRRKVLAMIYCYARRRAWDERSYRRWRRLIWPN